MVSDMYKYQRDRLLEEMYAPINKMQSIDKIKKPERDKRYVSLMGSMSYTYGNVLAWFQNHIIDMMPENLFKTVHVNSKIAHRQMRSTPHEFQKKIRPMIIFRPRIGSPEEDRFLKDTPLIQRQNNLYSTWGATSLQPFLEDPKNDLSVKFQQNRSILYVDVTMIFSSLMNQMDYVHYLENATAWNTPFLIKTCLESYIPQELLKIISDISNVPLYDKNCSTKDFLNYLEQNSDTPVTYKLQGSTGTKEFYRYYPTSIDMTLSDLNWDDGERVGHVMNSYQVTFSARLEFYSTGFYYAFSDKIYDIKLPVIEDIESGSVIPVFTDVFTKEDLNLAPGWHLYNQASCRLENERDKICIDELLNASIRSAIKYHFDNGMTIKEFLDIKVRRQGKLIHEGTDYKIDYNTMTVYFNNNSTFYTYKILICVNIQYINELMKTLYNLK